MLCAVRVCRHDFGVAHSRLDFAVQLGYVASGSLPRFLRYLAPFLERVRDPRICFFVLGPLALDEKEKLKKQSHFIFKKINVELQRKKIASQYVKLNIAYNTCAALEVAIILVFCMAILFEIEFIVLKRYDTLLSVISLDIFMIMCIYFLSNRSKKMYKYWIRNIVLAYQDIYLNEEHNIEEQN